MNVRAAHIVEYRPFMNAGKPRPAMGRPPLPVDEATPGGRLRALRIGAKLGQEDLAVDLGVSRTNISKYEAGFQQMPDYVLERASQRFAVTQAFIRYGETDERMVQVRGKVGAGAHIEAIDAPPWRYVEVPASWTDAIALQVDGVSNWPVYEDGDFLVIRGEQRLREDECLGKMCVVETADGLGLVKRVRRGSTPGLYTLESVNAPPLEDVPLISARPVRLKLSQ